MLPRNKGNDFLMECTIGGTNSLCQSLPLSILVLRTHFQLNLSQRTIMVKAKIPISANQAWMLQQFDTKMCQQSVFNSCRPISCLNYKFMKTWECLTMRNEETPKQKDEQKCHCTTHYTSHHCLAVRGDTSKHRQRSSVDQEEDKKVM